MKTIGLNGKTYIINPEKNSKNVSDDNSSSLHKEARKIIKECLPYSKIYEEVLLTGCANLIADFLVPEIPVMIEVHGAQHYKFIKHFHKTEEEFKESLKRDITKKDWAELNSIIYVELPYHSIKKWKKIINGHLSN